MKKCIILLSGGLDSATVLAMVKNQGFLVHALTVYYGQKNQHEITCAKNLASAFKVSEHKILNVDLSIFGGSSLTTDKPVLKHEEAGEMPNTYVPARNTIFLSLALAYAEVSKADDIFYGANIYDYSGYPDCRPEYVEAFKNMANLSTKRAALGHKINIHAPLSKLSKAQIIKAGLDLGLDYQMSISCYNPKDTLSCGVCSSCFYRKKGFLEAAVKDPTKYVTA